MATFAQELILGGARLLQYRNKNQPGRAMLAEAEAIRAIAPTGVRLIMNDRADLCIAAGFDGVDRKSTRLNSSHIQKSRMPSSA